MTRVFVPATVDDLTHLAQGQTINNQAFAATTEMQAGAGDNIEQAEFAALVFASDESARHGRHRIVVAADAEVDDTQHLGVVLLHQPVSINQVAAVHVGLDGDEDLAWYATQEIDAVLALIVDAGLAAD